MGWDTFWATFSQTHLVTLHLSLANPISNARIWQRWHEYALGNVGGQSC
jgi:hypothetical protein